MVVALTKKQQWKENDEWVVVGLKESKSVERGWIVVPDKNKKPSPDRGEPERVDKILARCEPLEELERATSSRSRPSPTPPRRHGVCKRSEAKSFIRHGRVTFEGEVVTRPDQKVVVRCAPIHPSTETA